MSQRNWQSIKSYEDIKFEFFEGIGKITINRPKVYNAFRPETNFEMLDAMAICRERPDINVVVLTGEGDKAFCSGGDQNVKGVGGYISENGVPRLNVLDLHKAIRSLPKPVIMPLVEATFCTLSATSRLLQKMRALAKQARKWVASMADLVRHIWLAM
jgi:naphthoate synthase